MKRVSEPDYRIRSDEALVVTGSVACHRCRADVEVLCLYCQTGFIDGEAAMDFSVSNVTVVDRALSDQLSRWPGFRQVRNPGAAVNGLFANHCLSCGSPQYEFHLHCDPGGPFFSFQDPAAGPLELHALKGLVRFSGDEVFER